MYGLRSPLPAELVARYRRMYLENETLVEYRG